MVEAANAVAASLGLTHGLGLADARALVPELKSAEADPAADARLLADLADWCGRYSPWTADAGIVRGEGAIWIDATGSTHLFGGEEQMLADLVGRLQGFGFSVRAALGATPGAAWAFARHLPGAEHGLAVPEAETRRRLAALPVRALRLSDAAVADLERYGLYRIGDMAGIARAPLAARLGTAPMSRLDQAFGRLREPVQPRRPVPKHRTRIAFPEPIGTREALAATLNRLLGELSAQLEREGLGARRVEVAAYRADGAVRRLPVGLAAPSRDPTHLERLLDQHLDKLDIAAGVEIVTLSAPETERIRPVQLALEAEGPARERAAPPPLVDRLVGRLGTANVLRHAPQASHVPERAEAWLPFLAPAPTPASAAKPRRRDRPVRLLSRPERVTAVSTPPHEPPNQFTWRGQVHKVARAQGPERIAPEWWRGAGEDRDYYRVEDKDGRRFWLYRDGPFGQNSPDWYLHGFFA